MNRICIRLKNLWFKRKDFNSSLQSGSNIRLSFWILFSRSTSWPWNSWQTTMLTSDWRLSPLLSYCGSQSAALKQRIQPKMCLFGHTRESLSMIYSGKYFLSTIIWLSTESRRNSRNLTWLLFVSKKRMSLKKWYPKFLIHIWRQCNHSDKVCLKSKILICLSSDSSQKLFKIYSKSSLSTLLIICWIIWSKSWL